MREFNCKKIKLVFSGWQPIPYAEFEKQQQNNNGGIGSACFENKVFLLSGALFMRDRETKAEMAQIRFIFYFVAMLFRLVTKYIYSYYNNVSHLVGIQRRSTRSTTTTSLYRDASSKLLETVNQ